MVKLFNFFEVGHFLTHSAHAADDQQLNDGSIELFKQSINQSINLHVIICMYIVIVYIYMFRTCIHVPLQYILRESLQSVCACICSLTLSVMYVHVHVALHYLLCNIVYVYNYIWNHDYIYCICISVIVYAIYWHLHISAIYMQGLFK